MIALKDSGRDKIRQRPSPAGNQIGTMLQEFLAIALYVNDPLRHEDPIAAQKRTRAAAIPHSST